MTTSRAARPPPATCWGSGTGGSRSWATSSTTHSASRRAAIGSSGYERALAAAGLEVEPRASWRSARTAATRPASWPPGSCRCPTVRPPSSPPATRRPWASSAPPTRPGLRVPDDLSVVGYDDIEIADYVGLTTVRQQLFESGPHRRRAAAGGDPGALGHAALRRPSPRGRGPGDHGATEGGTSVALTVVRPDPRPSAWRRSNRDPLQVDERVAWVDRARDRRRSSRAS